jgi:DNA-binding NtrC family response regulator
MKTYSTDVNLFNSENNKIPQGPHVLLIDNEDFLVKLWKNIFTKHGYVVTCFTDSKLALQAFKDYPYSFDIVITDQSMPFITGIELAKEFLKTRDNIKIILCTGYSEDMDMNNFKHIGISEILLKPFDNKALIKAVERNL